MILVTGATGFLGGYVVEKLVQAGIDQVKCFVRADSRTEKLQKLGVELSYGSFEEYGSFVEALNGVKTIVNVASLGFGHAQGIVRGCEEAGVERGIFFSTTAVFTTLNAQTKIVRLEAERLIKESSLKYTILRPSMIYGSNRDRNMCRLIKYLRMSPVIPVFGSGQFLQQPVYVEDLADAVVAVLNNEPTINKQYNLAGAKPLTYNQVIDTTCKALNRSVMKLHIPVGISVKLLGFYESVSKKPRFKAEQVLRLNEHKDFDIKEAVADFGYDPLDFETGIKKEIRHIYENDVKFQAEV